ncbi:hypothetical protein ACHAPU_005477 [Fusarium lateritium]
MKSFSPDPDASGYAGISNTGRKSAPAREDFSTIATEGFIDGEYVATALSAAEVVVDGMVFHIQRYYDQREEGLRICRERDYGKIGKTGYRNLFKRDFATLSSTIDTQAAFMKKERNKLCQYETT